MYDSIFAETSYGLHPGRSAQDAIWIIKSMKNKPHYLHELGNKSGGQIKEPLIDSAAHLRHIFSRLLLAEKEP